MPFQVTDEAMDALDQLNLDERKQMLSRLEPGEVQQVIDYHPTWLAKRRPLASSSEWTPNKMIEQQMQLAYEQGQRQPGTVAGMVRDIAKPATDALVDTALGHVTTNVLNAAQKETAYAQRELLAGTASLDPRNLLGTAYNVLKPDSWPHAYGAESDRPNTGTELGQVENVANVMKAKAYGTLPTVPGQSAVENSPQMAKASDYLLPKVGVLGATALMSGAEAAPALAFPAAKAKAAAGLGEATLGTVGKELLAGTGQAAAMNASIGAIQAPEGQRAEAAIEGAVNPMNLLFATPGALAVAGRVPGVQAAQRRMALVTQEAMAGLRDTIIAKANGPMEVSAPGPGLPEQLTLPKSAPSRTVPPSAKPSIAVPYESPRGGLVAALATVHEDGSLLTHTMPLSRDGDFAAFARAREKYGLSVYKLSPEQEARLSPRQLDDYYGEAGPMTPGDVAETQNGQLSIHKPVEAKPPPPPEQFAPGDKVYVQLPEGHALRNEKLSTPSNTFGSGEVLGRDAAGRLRVKMGESTYVVPESARVDYAWEPPSSDPVGHEPMPMPTHLSTESQRRFAESVALDKVTRSWSGKQLDRLKGFINPAARTTLIGPYLAEMRAAQHLKAIGQEARIEALNAAHKGFNPLSRMPADFDRDLSQVISGKMRLEDFASKHQQDYARVQQPLKDMLAKSEQNNALIRSLLGIPEDANIPGELNGAYAARLYLAHELGERWSGERTPTGFSGGFLDQKRVDSAVEFYQEAAKKAGKELTYSEALDRVADLLHADDPVGVLKGQNNAAFGHLKQRTDLPKPLRDVLGEVDSGVYRLASTVATQEAVLQSLRIFSEVQRAFPEKVSIGPQGGFKQLPDTPKFGVLRGRFVHPDIYEQVVGLPAALGRAESFLSKLLSWQKGNIVAGNFRLWNREFHGQFISMGWSGVPLADVPGWSTHLGKALTAWLQFFRNPDSAEPNVRLARDAIAYDAAQPGFGLGETGDARSHMGERFLKEAQKQLASSPGLETLQAAKNILGRMYGGALSSRNKVSGAYAMIQQTFQLTTFSYLQEKLLPKAERYARDIQAGVVPPTMDRLAKRVALELQTNPDGAVYRAASREAAARVRAGFIIPENVSPGIQQFLHKTIGLRNLFPTPILEEARIYAQLPRRMFEEPELRWAAAGNVALLGLIVALANEQRRMNGITDEQAKAALAIQRADDSYFHNAVVVGTSRDERGRVQLHDLSYLSTLPKLFQAMPGDPMWATIFANALKLPVSGTPVEGWLTQAMVNGGLISLPPQFDARQPLPGTTDLWSVLGYLNAQGLLGPTAISDVQRTLQKTGQAGPQPLFGETLTPDQGTKYMLGINTSPIGPNTVRASVLDDVRQLRELSAKGIIKKDPTFFNDPKKVQAWEQAVQQVSQQLQKKGQALQNAQPKR